MTASPRAQFLGDSEISAKFELTGDSHQINHEVLVPTNSV